MSRKTDDLEFRCQLIERKVSGIEDSLDILRHIVEEYSKNFDKDFNRMIDARINEKARVMVVDSLAAYQKGKAIKKQVDYISEVLKNDD